MDPHRHNLPPYIDSSDNQDCQREYRGSDPYLVIFSILNFEDRLIESVHLTFFSLYGVRVFQFFYCFLFSTPTQLGLSITNHGVKMLRKDFTDSHRHNLSPDIDSSDNREYQREYQGSFGGSYPYLVVFSILNFEERLIRSVYLTSFLCMVCGYSNFSIVFIRIPPPLVKFFLVKMLKEDGSCHRHNLSPDIDSSDNREYHREYRGPFGVHSHISVSDLLDRESDCPFST